MTHRRRGVNRTRALVLSSAVLAWAATEHTFGRALSTVAPTGASAGVSLSINGTAFNSVAANNEVRFSQTSGAFVSALATRVTDSGGGLMNLRVTVPAGLPAGTTTIKVADKTNPSNVSEGLTFQLLQLYLPAVTSARRGAANVDVEITGSPNTQFVNSTSTRAAFGAGITVNRTTVLSPNRVVANITVSATASLGVRTIGVTTVNQQALLADGFTITDVPPPPPPNQAPAVNAGSDQTIDFGATAALTGSVSDDGLPSGSAVAASWTMVSGPGAVTFANAAAAATTATFSESGTYVLRLTATDSSLSAQDDVSVIVSPRPPQNVAPTVNAGGDQTVEFGAAASLNGSVTDDGLPVGGGITNSWTQVSGPGTVSFANAAAVATTATFSESGTYVLRLTADDTVLSAHDELSVIVGPRPPQNVAPTVSAGEDVTITLPAQASLSGTVTDDGLPAGAVITTTWTKIGGPGTVTFGSASSLTTSAAFEVPGSYVLRLTADDTALTGFADVSVTVHPATPANQPPQVNAGADRTITLPATASLSGTVTDDGLPAGQNVTITWAKFSGPGTVTFGSATSLVTSASFDVAGSYVLRLTASDTEFTAASDVTITVNPATPETNQPPVVNAGTDLSSEVGVGTVLRGSAVDDGLPGGAGLTVLWTKTSGPDGMDFANPTTASTLATFYEPGTYRLRLTASDTVLNAASEVTVTVAAAPPLPPVNQPPVASAGPNQRVTLPDAATLAGLSTDDGLPTATLARAWTQVSGPGNASFSNPNADATTVTFSHAGTYVLRLTANDSMLSAASDVIVTAVAPNAAPIVSAGEDSAIQLPSNQVSLNGAALDEGLPAGRVLTTSWSVVSGPAPVAFGNTGLASTTATFNEPGSYVLKLHATDGERSTSDEVAITVAAAVTVASPSAIAGGPYTGQVGQPVLFDGRTSTDPEGKPLSFAWDFGDGSTATGGSPSHIYTGANNGTAYVVRLRVTAASGRTAEATTTASIAPVNAPATAPIASPGGPYAGRVGQAVVFDGSASSDPENRAIALTWDFGDGTTGSGTAPRHVYQAPAATGHYLVTLTVRNAQGGIDTKTTTATITAPSTTNRAPLARPGGPYSGTAGEAIAFDGSASSDADGDALTLHWTFGDSKAATGATVSHVYDEPGTYIVALTATDGSGAANTGTATVTVAAGTGNQRPVAAAGGPYETDAAAALAFDGRGSRDPDGDSLTFQWTFGDGAEGTGPAPTHTYAQPGTYQVALTVQDGRGGTDTATVIATVGASVDRAPPVVSLSAPSSVLPGTRFTAQASASDNVGVAAIAFAVTGAGTSSGGIEDTSQPYEVVVDAGTTAAPGSKITIHATARDAAGNASTAAAAVLVLATADTTPPAVTLRAPVVAAPGSTIVLTASATDNGGVKQIEIATGGAPVGTLAASVFQTTYTIAANAPVGASLVFVATAIDLAGNQADAQASIAIVAPAPLTPPAVAITAPEETTAGASVRVSAAAADERGIASVAFFIDGALLATVLDTPYEATFTVPANRRVGSVVDVRARALNRAGLSADSTAQTRIVGATAAASGVAGRVYDDTTSLPIAGAMARLVGTDADGRAYSATAVTDARGRYFLPTNGGDAFVEVVMDGWTRADRQVTFAGASRPTVFDARLTPLAPPAPVGAIPGGTIKGTNAVLSVPAGAIGVDTALAITRVGQQGLAGLLPAGWSPIAAAEVTPRNVSFDVPAALEVAPLVTAPSGSMIVLAEWRGDEHAWRAIGAPSTATDGDGPLTATISAGGQYAWLVADSLPAAPAIPAAGSLVAGTVLAAVPDAAAITITPSPKIAIHQPGFRAMVGAFLSPTSPLASGTPLVARISETYRMTAGGELALEPFVEGIIFYQLSAPPNALTASWTVAPSVAFEPADLRDGVIGIDVFLPKAAPDASTRLIGRSGGAVVLESGERVDIPPDALEATTTVDLQALSVTALGITLPEGLEILGAVSLAFAGSPELQRTAVVSVARPSSVAPGDLILVLRLEEILGATRLVMAGIGRLTADRILSDASVPGVAQAPDAIRREGRYLFVRAVAPIGFTTGFVLAPSGQALAGAIVSADTLPIVTRSQMERAYVIPVRVGAATVTAVDPARADAGSAQGTLANHGDVARLDIQLLGATPGVVHVAPADGAENVAAGLPIVVTFATPLDPASAGGSNAFTLTAEPSETAIAGVITLNNGNRRLTFRPSAPLAESTRYRVGVSATLRDLAGRPMPAAFTSRFTSLDMTPPTPPAAGAISVGVPDPDGFVTVTATQGTAAPTDRVRVYNLRRNTHQTAIVAPNGSFSLRVATSPGDPLRLALIDQAGNETSVELEASRRQENADGSVSAVIGIDGGRIEGPAGIAVDVPAGAFETPTVVTVKAVPATELPVQLTEHQKEFFSLVRGFALDFRGATPTTYLNVSLPAGPDDTEDDRWVIGQVSRVGDEDLFTIADTARLIDGRITTSSPPCPGVQAAEMYGLIKPSGPVGLTYFTPSPRTPDAAGAIIGSSNMFGALQSAQSGGRIPADGLSLPWRIAAASLPKPTCLPTLVGRASLVPARQMVVIGADQIRPDDRELVVRNQTSGIEYRFPRNLAQYEFTVDGSINDTLRVSVIAGSALKVVRFDRRPGPPGKVGIKVDMDQVHSTVTEVIVENLSATPPTTTRIAQPEALLRVPVTGAASDSFGATAVAANGTSRTVNVTVVPLDQGNVVLKVRDGTVDPDATVTLIDVTTGGKIPIPSSHVVLGGIQFGFDGVIDHSYELHLTYTDGTADERSAIPQLRLSIASTTGRTLRTITVPTPPADDPYNLGIVDPGTPRPSIVETPSPLSEFDPSHPLTFRFSTGVSRSSVLQGLKIEEHPAGGGSPLTVEGEIRLSENNTVVTFVPKAPLRIAARYMVSFTGVADGLGRTVPTSSFEVRTFTPRQIADSPAANVLLGWAHNIVLRRITTPQGKTQVLAYRGNQTATESRIAIVDVTNPAAPVVLGQSAPLPADSSHQVALATDVSFTTSAPSLCGATQFRGDLLVDATSSGAPAAALHFYDVTRPDQPCLISTRLVSLPPSIFASPSNLRRDVFPGGAARSVAIFKTTAGATAFVAVGEVGIVAVDVASTIKSGPPSGAPQDRPPMRPGDYGAVVPAGSLLLAPERAERQLHILDSSLSLLTAVDLSDTGVIPQAVAYTAAFPLDYDNDGTVDSSEQRDLAFVSGLGGIVIVDLSNPGDASVIGTLGTLNGSTTHPPEISQVTIDREQRRVYALGTMDSFDAGERILVFELSGPEPLRSRDDTGDGLDDRLIWQSPQGTKVGSGVFAFAFDADRGYLITDYGSDTWSMVNVCCDLGVELAARPMELPEGDADAILQRELLALKQEIAAGLQDAGACGVPIRPAWLREQEADAFLTIIEQGSGACLWKPNPIAACHGVYVPGISDHDFEVFMPKQHFEAQADCVAKALEKRFVNVDGTPKPIDVGGVKVMFGDITFFPVRKEGFESGFLDLTPPTGAGTDVTGDLGLGRQQLLLKWLLEGEYIEVAGFNLKGQSLEKILTQMRAGAGIPRLEGFEWATLQSYNLAKAMALLRVPGSAQPAHALHDFYLDQLHDAGKAAIRAALARMIENEFANQVVMSTTRAQYTATACLDIQAGTTPDKWLAKPCTSFEEFVASIAGHLSFGTNPIFPPQEVANTIHRFYRVKADRERIVADDAATQFVAEAARFIKRVEGQTSQTWSDLIQTDPNEGRRRSNLNEALSKRIKANQASLHVVPRVFNHSFRSAPDIDVVMYRGVQTPGAPDIRTVRVSFDPAEERYLDRAVQVSATPPDGITPADRNLNDTSRHDHDLHKPIFMLGDPTDPANPPVALDSNFNTVGYVSFTIDLPGRTMKEPDRLNNYDGFWFYVVDPDNPGAAPTVPAKPPLPLTDPTVIQPDAACVPPADLRVTQAIVFTDPGSQPIEIGDQFIGQPGQAATLRVRVFNESAQDVTNVKVCPSVLADTGVCAQIPSIQAGSQEEHDFAFVLPTQSQIFLATTTASSPSLGVRTSAPLRIIVGCESYAVVPLPDDPNPDASLLPEVMRGGWAIRYYRVIDFNTGRPLANAAVTIDVADQQGNRQTLTHFRTDADGYVEVPPSIFKPDILGIPLEPFTKGFAIPIDPATPVGTRLTAKLSSVNGVAPYCAAPQTFQVKVVDRTVQRSWKGGASIGAAGTVEVGMQGKAGAGLQVSLTEGAGTGRQLLSIARSESIEAGILYQPLETGVLAEAGPIKVGAVAKVTAGAVNQGSVGDQFDFKFGPGNTLTTEDSRAVAALILKSLLIEGPILAKVVDVIKNSSLTHSISPNKTAETVGLGFEVAGGSTFSIQAGMQFTEVFTALPQQNKPQTTVTGFMNMGADLTIGGGVKFGMLGSTAFNPQTQEVTSGYELRGQIDFTSALTIGSGQSQATSSQGRIDEKLSIKNGIKVGLKGTPLAENFKLALTRDASQSLKPTKLALLVGTAKNFGFEANILGKQLVPTPGTGNKATIKFTISDPDKVAAVVNNLPTLRMTQTVPVGATLPISSAILIGPIVAAAEMVTVVNAMDQIDAEFDVTIEDGVATQLPFSFEGAIFGFGAKFSSQASLDKTITWTAAKGAVRKGKFYPTEHYFRDPMIPSVISSAADDLKVLAEATFGAWTTQFHQSFDTVLRLVGGPSTELKSNHTAQMLIDGTNETPFQAALVSFEYSPTTESSPVYRPDHVAGPADRPHYGIGGFHQFLPADRILASPATLTIFYEDQEVLGLNEASLAVYRWNDERDDWEHLGGGVDTTANTVRVTVDRFGLYTAAPVMPAGFITFTSVSSPAGDAALPRTIVAYTSGVIRTNTGQTVPDGTKFTVYGADASTDLTERGAVLTADEDPGTEGIQVSALGGIIRFSVDYPGSSGIALPFAYSVVGTAISKDALPLRPPQ